MMTITPLASSLQSGRQGDLLLNTRLRSTDRWGASWVVDGNNNSHSHNHVKEAVIRGEPLRDERNMVIQTSTVGESVIRRRRRVYA